MDMTNPVPPETKYEITSEALLYAREWPMSERIDWFYHSSGAELKKDEAFKDILLYDKQNYTVLVKARVLDPIGILSLRQVEGKVNSTSFIFIDCILPAIHIDKGGLGDLAFVRSHIGGNIWAQDNCRIERLRILDNSRSRNISIEHKSTIGKIIIEGNSQVDDVLIANEGECYSIDIGLGSRCKNISIYGQSSCLAIKIIGNSIIEDLIIGELGDLKGLIIDNNSQAGFVWVQKGGECGEIKVMSSSQNGNIVVDGNVGHMSFHDKSECGKIHLRNGGKGKDIKFNKDSKGGDIEIIDGGQNESISVYDNSECGDIKIDGKGRCARINFNKGKCGQVNMADGSHVDIIRLHNESFCEFINTQTGSKCLAISIDGFSLIGHVGIYSNSHIGSLVVLGHSFCRDIMISDGKADKIQVTYNYCSVLLHGATVALMQLNNCHLHELRWQAGTKAELYIDACTINHLNLYKTSMLKDTVLSIVKSSIYIIQLQELLAQGQLILRNIAVAKVPFVWGPRIITYIESLRPEENAGILLNNRYAAKQAFLKKYEVDYGAQLREFEHTRPLFRIVNSSLGKTEITGSDLRYFHFEYRDSKLLEVFISGTQLPREKIDIYHGSPESVLSHKIYFEQKVSIYNQLKRIFENQGDIVEGTWYHSKAMANQQRLLSLYYKERMGKLPGKWWSEEAFDLLNFQLNKMSNNHGESWRRALCFSFYVLFPVYTLYFISINWGTPFAWSGADDFVGNFFSFLDFTHKIDFMVDKERLNGFAKFLDFFGRVATGYCIFQFIAAFRRHGKKG